MIGTATFSPNSAAAYWKEDLAILETLHSVTFIFNSG